MLLSFSKSSAAFWLGMSEWALLVFGALLVVGLIGEYRIDHGKCPKFKKRKWLFELFVIVGVAGELFGDGGIFLFSGHLQTIADREIEQLRTDNAVLVTMGDNAKKSATEAVEAAEKDNTERA